MSTGFTTKLEHAAEDSVKKVAVPKKKVGPDPPHSSHVGSSSQALIDADLPLTARTFVDHPALERALEKGGVRVPSGDSARLIDLAEEWLAGRTLDALKTAERDALENALRQELVKLSTGVKRRQKDLLKDLKEMFSVDIESKVNMSMTSVQGGTWVFFHSPSSTKPVILSEAFVPNKAGAAMPKSRPSFKDAGITGTPTWKDAAGRISSTPPSLPARPTKMPSGLTPPTLDQAPALILEELARARNAAVQAAERQAAPIKLVRLAPGTRHAGDRISRIEKFAPSQPGGEWDELFVVEGVTGQEISRMPNAEMDKVLPEIGTLTNDPQLKGKMARMHVFGPIFGDETLAGVAFGPHEEANLLAMGNTEAFARFGAKGAGRVNVKAGTPVKVSQYVKYRPIKGAKNGRYPFVVSVKYQYTLESGELVTAVINISPKGEVTFFIDG